MQEQLKRIADSNWFHTLITVIILLAGLLVGVETYGEFAHRHHATLVTLDRIVLGIFITEIVIKMGAEGSKPWRYFLDPWNVFDFVIVAACFLPFEGQAVTVLRLLRLLRVLKLVKALPKLQLIVNALLKAIPSMIYVTLLLLMLFYVYAVAAVFMFGENDPAHFGNLQIALLSLFRVVTLEGWTELMYINMWGCENFGYDEGSVQSCPYGPDNPSHMHPLLSALFFVSFVLSGTMVILNLFVGVIMNGIEEAQAEADRERLAVDPAKREPADRVALVERELAAVQDKLATLRHTLAGVSDMTNERR